MDYTYNLIIRWFVALFFGVFFKIYYIIFSPPTFYASYLLLKMIGSPTIIEDGAIFSEGIGAILMGGIVLRFVKACTAASAYFLLTILIALTKDIGWKKSLEMFAIGSILIFTFNLIRVNVLIAILVGLGVDWFNYLHLFFWKVLSTIAVVGIWILLIKAYKIKNIPVYSDVIFLLSEIKKGKIFGRS
ncbi:pacearchaeosortase [Candidatus Woesearchaeota archaeon]|nr:pacearchaeosortase [Candidatus Woesearchaeota archaeon]